MNATAAVITPLDFIATKALKGLQQVVRGETETMAGWMHYGSALNEGRRLHLSDREFGQWVKDMALSQLATREVTRDERVAAMWAAARPTDFSATKELNPKVRTLRGLHARWKQGQKGTKQQPQKASKGSRTQTNAANTSAAPNQNGPSSTDRAQRAKARADEWYKRMNKRGPKIDAKTKERMEKLRGLAFDVRDDENVRVNAKRKLDEMEAKLNVEAKPEHAETIGTLVEMVITLNDATKLHEPLTDLLPRTCQEADLEKALRGIMRRLNEQQKAAA